MTRPIKVRIEKKRVVDPPDFPEDAEGMFIGTEAAGDDPNRWVKELFELFAPVRERLREVPEEEINRRIARAVKAVRARDGGQA